MQCERRRLASSVLEHHGHEHGGAPAYRWSESRRRNGRKDASERALVDALILSRDGLNIPRAAELQRHANATLSVELGFEPPRKAVMNRGPKSGDDEVDADRLSIARRLGGRLGEPSQHATRSTVSEFGVYNRVCLRALRVLLVLPGVHGRIARAGWSVGVGQRQSAEAGRRLT